MLSRVLHRQKAPETEKVALSFECFSCGHSATISAETEKGKQWRGDLYEKCPHCGEYNVLREPAILRYLGVPAGTLIQRESGISYIIPSTS